MNILIGLIVRLITFPGVILDLITNVYTAKFLKIEIVKINYASILTGNPVEIKEDTKYYKLFLFAFIPFIVLTIVAIPFCYKAVEFNTGRNFLICLWLGLSIAAHSFPEIELGKLIWNRTNLAIKQKKYLAALGYPFVFLIYIIRFLNVLWLDILYGLGIILIIDYYFFKK